MPLIRITVIAGVFTLPQKQEIIERVTDAMVAIEGENMRQTVRYILDEVDPRRSDLRGFDEPALHLPAGRDGVRHQDSKRGLLCLSERDLLHSMLLVDRFDRFARRWLKPECFVRDWLAEPDR